MGFSDILGQKVPLMRFVPALIPAGTVSKQPVFHYGCVSQLTESGLEPSVHRHLTRLAKKKLGPLLIWGNKVA